MFKSVSTTMQATVLAVSMSAVLLGFPWTESLAGEISARVQPDPVSEDMAARLTVSLSGAGTSSSRPRLPSVEGLEFVPEGTTSQVQYLNGEVSSVATYTFRIEARRTGEFTIPPITAEVDGRVEKTRPLNLTVVKSGAVQGPQRRSAQPPLSGSGSARSVTKPGSIGREAAFLEFVPRKGRLYLGEMIPVEIRAYFRDGLGVGVAPPRLEGDAFVLHDLSKEPEKTRVRIGDGTFTMLKWDSAISAIKEGRYPIVAKLDATLQVPRPAARRPSFGRGFFGEDFFNDSFFNDDFFNQFFGGFEEREVALSSARRHLRVEPLPVEGRPENFSGAVGQFKLSASAKPTKVAVGDPMTLQATLKGRGNFDRAAAPELTDKTGWKTYSPTDAFRGTDSLGHRGTKRFEQAIVPQHSGLREIPPMSFSYFDTQRKEYVTLKTKPIPIHLTGGAVARRVSPGVPPPGAPAEADGLLPIRLELGSRSASLEPVVTRPWFWAAQGLPLSALIVGLLLHRRHRRIVENPEWLQKKETHRQVSEALGEMEAAAQRGDTKAFVAAGHRAVKQSLGELWGVPPETLTLAEIKTRRPEGSDAMRRIFAAADALAYSGQMIQVDNLQHWQQEVFTEIAAASEENSREVR